MKSKKYFNNKINYSYKKNLPLYCDLNCKYARFSNPETVGACRTAISVWCGYFKKYNYKHNKCLAAVINHSLS